MPLAFLSTTEKTMGEKETLTIAVRVLENGNLPYVVIVPEETDRKNIIITSSVADKDLLKKILRVSLETLDDPELKVSITKTE